METARTVTKSVVRFLARGGTATAVSNIIASNRSHSDNEVVDTYYKTSAVVGGFVAGYFVGDYIGAFAESKVDDLFDKIEEATKKN